MTSKDKKFSQLNPNEISIILCYTGAKPESINDPVEGQLLCILELQKNNTYWGSVIQDGTFGFFRVYDKKYNVIFDGTFGTSGTDIILSSLFAIKASLINIELEKNEMKTIKIYTILSSKPFIFIGKYRRDLEKPNWHYYETEDKTLIHFRKKHMIAVFEDNLLIDKD